MRNLKSIQIVGIIVCFVSLLCSTYLISISFAAKEVMPSSIVVEQGLKSVYTLPDVTFVKEVIKTIFNVVRP